MKLRHTFTLAPDVASRAKHYAKGKGVSLSSLVEELLREKTQPEVSGKVPSGGPETFSRRWMGKGIVSDKDEPRLGKLRKKYNL